MGKKVVNKKSIYLLFQLMVSLIIFCMFPNITNAAIKSVGDTEEIGYTGGIRKWDAPYTGYYQLEVWGAQGGNAYGGIGGYGAYATGVVYLEKNEPLFIVVGGRGTSVTSASKAEAAGGYNGGGRASGDGNTGWGAGGGATHIAKSTGLLSTLSDKKNDVLIVAAGGGGAGHYTKNVNGGNGGGITGNRGSGSCGGYAGTQSAGGAGCSNNARSGGFGYGAPGYSASGGGAGWYGGGTGYTTGSGGGGGSSYIENSLLLTRADVTKSMYCVNCKTSTVENTYTVSTTSVSSTATSYAGKSGEGAAKITLVEVVDMDSRLNTVNISGTSFSATFDKDNYTYNLLLDSENATINVSATAVLETTEISGVGTIDVPVGQSTITLVGTSLSGDTSTYTINVTRPASSYKYLKDIKIGGESIAGFNPTTLTYNIDIPYSVTKLDLDALKGRPGQSVYKNDGFKLVTGSNRYEVVVVSEDGQYTTTYILNITKPHSSKLKSLNLGGYALSPTFNSETLEYDLTIFPTVFSLVPEYEVFDEEAKVTIEGFGYIKNNKTAKITVKEPNCADTVYTINIIKNEGAAEPVDFPYNGNIQTFVVPMSGYYQLEVWGAQGGNAYGGIGGYGAYATGVVFLDKDEVLYVVPGSQGGSVSNAKSSVSGGYNGGGSSKGDGHTGWGAGGGATHIAKSTGLLSTFSGEKDDVLIVAGGGGGAGHYKYNNNGGNAGGIAGNRGSGSCGGYAGTQSAGGAGCSNNAQSGGFGYGGIGVSASGGGAGWYGGGTGYTYGSGGGGGSSYIGNNNLLTYNEVTKAMYGYGVTTSNDESTYTVSTNKVSDSPVSYYAKKGDGYARITLLKKPSQNNFLSSLTVRATNYATKISAVKNYTPPFDLEEGDYYVTLDTLETEITLIARPEDSTANIKGLGTFEVPAGTTTFPITVTSEAGTEKVYKVHVTRPASSDQYPIDIIISGLVPSLCSVGNNNSFCKVDTFDPNVKEYELIVPYRIKQLQFDVQKGHPNQTVSGEGKITLQSGLNEIIIDVTSEDENNTERYIYRITRDMTGDTDINFKLLDPNYDINFEPDISEYYITVNNSYDKYMYIDGNAPENKGKTSNELKDETLAELKETIQMYIKTDDENANFVVSGPTTLETGMNEVNVIVVASSGDTKTYIFHIYRSKNENAFLSGLEVVNTTDSSIKYLLNPEFSNINLGTYQVVVENNIEEVNIVANPEVGTSKVTGAGNVELNTGSNKKNITVTAENGTIETYTIDIVRKKNNNTFLSDITVFNGTTTYTLDPSFDKEKIEYNVAVEEGIETISIEASPEVSTTTYKLLDNNQIKVGKNIKRVMAIAEDGSSKIYTININRPASTNNYLSELIVKNGETEFTLNPSFDKEKEEYALTVENEINSVEVLATLENYLTKITGTGKHSLAVGVNTITVSTISEDGNNRDYTIEITRKPNNNAYLKSIATSAGTLEPEFNKTTNKYTINVGNEVTEIEITGSPEKTTTTVTGNNTYELKTSSSNIITLTTLAEDQTSTETYEIEVIRDKSNNTNLKKLWMEEGELSPEFKPQTINYTARVPYEVTTSTFHVELDNKASTYEIIGDYDNLQVGENEITIRVKSEEDPENIYKDYIVTVTRQEEGTTSSYLSSLTVSSGTLTPKFDKETSYYEVFVPYEDSKVKISATSEDVLAKISGTGEKNLKTGKNLFTIKVEATDGKTRDYQIMIEREASNEARLESLILDGSTLSPMFDKNVYEYTTTTNNSYLEFIQIKTVDENAFFSIDGNYFTENGEHTVTIEVTAPDMKTTKTYTIVVTKKPNNNNNLDWLEVEGYKLTPAFSNSITLYNVTVPNDVNSVNVIAFAESELSEIEGDGIQAINVGQNYLTVTVTSESGIEKVYTIIINKEGNNDNSLTDLDVLNGKMEPSFDGRTEYNVEVEYSETSLDLKVILSDPNASYTILDNNLNVGQNKVTIVVSAENGEINNYILNVTRKEIVSALLEDLIIKNYNSEPAFNRYVTSYDILVNNETESLDLTPIPLDKNATWTITGNENFVVGDNVVTIEVIASDGITKETYTLNVKRQIAANTYLDYLYTDKGDLTPTFTKEIMKYSITVPYETDKIELVGEAQDKSTTVTGLGEHSIKTGENIIPVTVTAQNGIKRVYYVTVIRSKNDDNFLASLIAKVGGKNYDLNPEFSQAETEYRVEVPVGTSSINLIGTLSSDTATVEGLGIHTLQSGENTLVITVTSESGNKKEYKVIVNRPANDNNHLIEITPSAGDLEPEFSYEETNYTINLDSSVGTLSFNTVPEDQNATVTGGESQVVPDGTSTRKIVVKAENGSEREYTITINKERTDNALLENLYVTSYPFDDGVIFAENITEYHITVPNNKQILLASEVVAVPKDKNAKITYSGNVSLSTNTEIEYAVTVTAPDGFTKKTYKIKIAREKSPNALLSLLKVNVGYLKENFNPTTFEYTWVVPKRTTLTPESVVAIAQDNGATIEKTASIYVTSVTTEQYIVKVTSEDGSTQKEYVINIEADTSSDKTLGSLNIDKGYYTPQVSETVTEFDVYEYVDTDKINVEAIPNNEDSKVTAGNGEVILTSDETTHTITVTAEDGSTENYILKIHRTIKKDEGLKNLGLNNLDLDYCGKNSCIISPEFVSDNLSYKIKVPYEYEDLDILAEKMNNQQTVKYKVNGTYITNYTLPMGSTIVEVEVYDGMNKLTRTYNLEVERCKSSNNYLKKLTVGKRNLATGNLDLYDLEPAFDKKIQEYTIYIEKDVEEVEIFGEPELEGNPVTINGYNYLQDGTNDATITVVAPDGSSRVYIIHIIKDSEYNSLIKNIYVSTGTFWDLSPKFKSTTYDYVTTITGPYEKVTINAVPVVPSTVITGTGEIELKTGSNVVTLVGTSYDDEGNITSTTTYTINVIKTPSINVDLESLIVEEGTLNPNFDSGTTKYNISVGDTVNKLTIHAIPKDRTSTIRITGNENLVSGENYVNIIVTNKEKTASKTYRLLVTKDKSSNSALQGIKVFDDSTEYPLKPTFAKETLKYSVKIPHTQEKVSVEAKTDSPYALVMGNGEYYLNYGHNVKQLIVTSEAGNISTYEVDIYREYDLYLKNLETDTGELQPEFNKNELLYRIEVPYTTAVINLMAEPNSNKVTLTGDGEYTLETGENTIKIITQDPDNNKRVHTIIVNRAKNDNNYIKELNVEGFLEPAFEKTNEEYTVHVRKDVTSLNLDIKLEAEDANYEILNNSDFTADKNPNKVTIRVTAENGDIRDYILNVNLQPDEFFSNRLLDLKVSEGKLVPDFNSDINNYTVIVANSIDKITIETIKENPYSKVTYNGNIDNTVPLELGRNVIEVTVTNQEGFKNNYYVIVYREESSDASLISLNVKGFNILPIFTKNNLEYTLDIGSETTSLEIEAVPYDPKSTIQITGHKNIKTGTSDIKILVTAPDGVTQKEYVIKVTKGISKNNYLSDLNVSGYTFDKTYNKLDQGPYTINVDSTTNSIMINATPEVSTTIVTGDGAVPIHSGQNIITVNATSESGDVRPYTIIVNRSKSNDSSLKDILLSESADIASLEPEFDPATTEYTIAVPKDLERITITGVPNALTSIVSGNGTYPIDKDEFIVTLEVTAEDGSKTPYKIKIERDASYSSKLKKLIVKDGELYPGFHKLITTYTILVPNEITSLNMNYEPEDSEANITITGNENFKIGTNTVKIEVEARDASETTTYIISVIRQPIASNYLFNLEVEGQTLKPAFNKETLYYEVEVPLDVDTINIIAQEEDPTSTVSGTGLKSLNKGINRFYVKVESASGVIRTYQIEVNRKESEENYLLTLESNIGTFNPVFDKNTNSYRLSVPEGTAEINLTGTASPNTIVIGLGKVDVPLGGTNHSIIVTSESGSTNTYNIEIIRVASNNTELIDLIPNVGTLEYSNDILEYTLEVPDSQNVISFTATPMNPASTITGTDLTNIDYGENKIEIIVTAEDGITTRTIEVKVIRMKALISIIPSETNIVITKGEEKTLTYTLNPTDTKYPDVEWLTSDSTIASVDENGKITGIEFGSTTIKIVSKHDSTIMASINVNVVNLRITSQIYDVVRFTDEEKEENPDVVEHVIGAEPKMVIDDFLAQFDNELSSLHVYDQDGNEITYEPDIFVGTGMTMKLILEDKTYDEIKIVVRGDLDGDGYVLMADYATVKDALLSIIELDYILERAADVDSDGYVLMADYATLKDYLLSIISTLN